MTYAERLTKGLLAMGWKIDHADRSRYVAFTHVGHKFKLFVGPNGALRSGRTASASSSIGDATRQNSFYKGIVQRGTPPEKVSIHSLAAEFGMDTDVAVEIKGVV